MVSVLIAIFVVSLGSVFAGFASLWLKQGGQEFRLNVFEMLKNKYFTMGIFGYVIAALLLLSVLKSAELSVLYPVFSLNYLWVALLSALVLKEKVGLQKWMGVGLILLGVVLITLQAA